MILSLRDSVTGKMTSTAGEMVLLWGKREAGCSVGYVEFEVKAGDACEKVRISLPATPCFDC